MNGSREPLGGGVDQSPSAFTCAHGVHAPQEELETVIPQVGGKVLLVNGAYRGEVWVGLIWLCSGC